MKTAIESLGIENGSSQWNDLNRRDFLKLSGLAGAGLIVSIGLFDPRKANAAVANGVFEPSAYLKIGSDGKIIIMSKNPEIGQGVKTSMPQIIAEELEVDWKQIEVVQAPLDNSLGDQFAGGSTAIKENFIELRRAGAAAKEMLIEAASRKWKVSLNECYASEGFVVRRKTNDKLSYAELADDASKLNVRENPKLKEKKDYKIIGKAIGGVDNKKIRCWFVTPLQPCVQEYIILFVGVVLKERCTTPPIQARPLYLPRGSWSSFMWISLVLPLIRVLVGRNIVW